MCLGWTSSIMHVPNDRKIIKCMSDKQPIKRKHDTLRTCQNRACHEPRYPVCPDIRPDYTAVTNTKIDLLNFTLAFVSSSTLLVWKTVLVTEKILRSDCSFPVECSTHQLKELHIGFTKELVEFLEDGRGNMRVSPAF